MIENTFIRTGRVAGRTNATLALILLAAATLAIHLATGGRYGFHRDELATLDDARHLAWGYVAYPPLTPFFGRLSLELFGTSVAGFRFFAALAQAGAVLLAGLMAREMGGSREAQLIAAAAAVPACLAEGALMQYVSFDYFFWVLTAYFVVRLLGSGDPRWWPAAGAAAGFGFLSKYTIAFLVAGILAGVLLSPARATLRTRWFWYGCGIAALIALPNAIWQLRHDFVSLEFLRRIHARDVAMGRTRGFLPGQLQGTLLATPLWIAGLWFCLTARRGRFRPLAWMYMAPLALFTVAQGRFYYLLPAYPMLYASGSVLFTGWFARHARWRIPLRTLAWAALALDAALMAAIMLPLAPVNSAWWKTASAINEDLREEIGWPDLAAKIAEIRDSLPPEERSRARVLAANYGEAGAINLYGPAYGLAPALSGANSFWYRGYGNPPPEVLIVLGFPSRTADSAFRDCHLAGRVTNSFGVRNEETADHPDIFVCHGPRAGWPEFWKRFRLYE
jgi:hypothetical protein